MIRQDIIIKLIDALESISARNGFYTDGFKVYEWLSKPLEAKDFPAVIVRDVRDELEDGTPLKHKLNIEIDIALHSEHLSINLREMLSDVLRAVGEFEKNNNLDVVLVSNEFLTEYADALYGGVRVEIVVIYHSQRWEQ